MRSVATIATHDGGPVLDAYEIMTLVQEVEQEVADGVERMVMEIHVEGGTIRIMPPQEGGKEVVQINKRLR